MSIISNLVMGQMQTQVPMCPNGYYLATDNLCYPQQQQQQPQQQQQLTPQEIQNCKIEKDSLALDKVLGANASQTIALGRLLNDTCGSIGDR